MARAIWKGAISFGLVTIPIRVHTAVEEKSFKFNQLHSKDQGRIKYKRTCAVDGAMRTSPGRSRCPSSGWCRTRAGPSARPAETPRPISLARLTARPPGHRR